MKRSNMCCSFCREPIRLVRLNQKVRAAACKNPRCIYRQRVYVETNGMLYSQDYAEGHKP